MEPKIKRALDILSLYDKTLFAALVAYKMVREDGYCDEETVQLAENLIIAIILDKSNTLLPDSIAEQKRILNEAEGINEVIDSIRVDGHREEWMDHILHMPLINHVTIGYAALLSQSSYGWRPWERVRDALLEEGDEDES